MAQQITTLTTIVPTVTEDALARELRKLGERESDLAQFAGAGWVLAHTHVLAGADHSTFVDTLTRTHDE